MIMPPGHGLSLRKPPVWSRREKRIVVAVAGAVAVFMIAVAVAVLTASHSTGNGCVDVQIPSPVGGSELYRCGGQARSMCRLVGAPGGYGGSAGAVIATECRKAGLPVG
jgi:hypothetical protein